MHLMDVIERYKVDCNYVFVDELVIGTTSNNDDR